MNEQTIKEKFKKDFERYGVRMSEDEDHFEYESPEPSVILNFISNLLQQQRDEIKKEVLGIGEHFVKFGEKKGVEAIDMVLAVINSPQNRESKK